MFNVIFYEKEITSTSAPQKTNKCHLHSLTNGTNMFGDCNNLTTFTADLSSLTNGSSMFYETNLESFTSNLSSLTNGTNMFKDCNNLTTFTSDLSSLTNGSSMFENCNNLESFTSNLSSLTNGNYMFYETNLESFTSDLSSLTKGSSMFENCNNLESFTSDLSSLTNGTNMFGDCNNLTTFTADLSSLTNGNGMFFGCKLDSFTSDLSSLTDGANMFWSCFNLTTFTADLNSLTYAENMFTLAKLTPQSVMYIAESIKDIVAEKKLYQDGIIPYVTYDTSTRKYSAPKGFMSDGDYVYTYNSPQPYSSTISASGVGILTIGINVTNDATTIADQLQAFAEEATFDSWEELKQTFVDKGWTVTWQYGGSETSITYDMRGNRAIPCPVYTRLIEISPEGVERDEEGNETGNMIYTDKQKNRAKYTNEDGSKFYNINWGHDVTNPQNFQQFDSLEDAAVAYGVFLKENIITT